MFNIDISVPKEETIVGVRTTENRGFTPEELAQQCVEKVISVSDSAHPGIRDQARAFSKHIRSDRTTVYNALNDAGHPELAELIRRL
jgi:hypothetical protein